MFVNGGKRWNQFVGEGLPSLVSGIQSICIFALEVFPHAHFSINVSSATSNFIEPHSYLHISSTSHLEEFQSWPTLHCNLGRKTLTNHHRKAEPQAWIHAQGFEQTKTFVSIVAKDETALVDSVNS